MNEVIKKQIIEAVETHKKMIAELQESGIETLAAAAEAITKALKQDGRVYICGNGGSAADAQHIAAELVGRFARQVEALVREGDILWVLSTSGSSANVVAAAELAKQKGACVLAFTGKPDSKLEQIADICFCANDKSTARSQEIHQVAYHIICDIVEQSFCERLNQK
jgi:D-sedoheptulose 7-phosphate isomerase